MILLTQSGDEAVREDGGGRTSLQRSQSAVSEQSDPTVRVPGETQRHQCMDTRIANISASRHAHLSSMLMLTWLKVAFLCLCLMSWANAPAGRSFRSVFQLLKSVGV